MGEELARDQLSGILEIIAAFLARKVIVTFVKPSTRNTCVEQRHQIDISRIKASESLPEFICQVLCVPVTIMTNRVFFQ
jgi:hypothetical protein